jgi:ketosteroid isomerase-like protein
MRPKGAPGGMRASGNIMGVLRRQPDGTWKVWRAIWNLEKPSPERAADGH